MLSFPQTIVYAPLAEEQRKKLIFRNLTVHRLVVKLQPIRPNSVTLSHRIVDVQPGETAEESFIFKPEFTGDLEDGLLVFVRLLDRHNSTFIAQWIKEISETKNVKNLAFKIHFKVTSALFNAQKVILDLPGKASLDENYTLFEMPTEVFTAASWPNLYEMARQEEQRQVTIKPELSRSELSNSPMKGIEVNLWSLLEYMLLFLVFLIAVVKLQFLH